MMFPPITKFAYRLAILLILFCAIAACGIYPGTSRGPIPSPLSSPLLTPTSMTSPLGISESTPTPTRTPTPTSDVNFDPAKVTPRPTLTPTTTPVVINLAEAWPLAFTYRFVIQRANGQREVYYVPVGFVPMVRTEDDRKIYNAYVASQLKLGPDDVYLGGCATSYWLFFVPHQMRCTPPKYPPAMGPTPTP